MASGQQPGWSPNDLRHLLNIVRQNDDKLKQYDCPETEEGNFSSRRSELSDGGLVWEAQDMPSFDKRSFVIDKGHWDDSTTSKHSTTPPSSGFQLRTGTTSTGTTSIQSPFQNMPSSVASAAHMNSSTTNEMLSSTNAELNFLSNATQWEFPEFHKWDTLTNVAIPCQGPEEFNGTAPPTFERQIDPMASCTSNLTNWEFPVCDVSYPPARPPGNFAEEPKELFTDPIFECPPDPPDTFLSYGFEDSFSGFPQPNSAENLNAFPVTPPGTLCMQGPPPGLPDFQDQILHPQNQPPCPQKVFVAQEQISREGKMEMGEKTLMIRGIPCSLTQEDMLNILDNAGFQGLYNFFYMPRFQANLGYAFVNFLDGSSANAFKNLFDGKQLNPISSEKVCTVSLAHIQGTAKLKKLFRRKRSGAPYFMEEATSTLPHPQ